MKNTIIYTASALLIIVISALTGIYFTYGNFGNFFASLSGPHIQGKLFTIHDTEPNFSPEYMLQSQSCTQSQFDSFGYKDLVSQLDQQPQYNRRQWEMVYIIKALQERSMLTSNKNGVGFGLISDPLRSLFAKPGMQIVFYQVNKIISEDQGQIYAQQVESLGNHFDDKALFNNESSNSILIKKLESSSIPSEFQIFDFLWSSATASYLGSIDKGERFILDSVNSIKPGGVAVHILEYNLSSNEGTIFEGSVVLFRKKDIQKIVTNLVQKGHEVYLNLNPGSGKLDYYIDPPPYKPNPHIKAKIGGYASTSFGIIIRKKSE
ncbi:MAG: hypothetical protein SFT91_00560 [Rickettsiaceae bacterium]|nr:hypothetical protein [Rickettsiaceae bacterium]